jgi:hypothetical protein
MPRTMQQSRVTFVIREDILGQALAESAASTLTMAELIRRAIDTHLTLIEPPNAPSPGELLGEQVDPETGEVSFPVNKKYPIHINDGLLGELERYARIVKTSPDEVVNRSLALYMAALYNRRRAAELCEPYDAVPIPTEFSADDPANDAGDAPGGQDDAAA